MKTIASFTRIAAFAGTIPGSRRVECGKYLDHDLPGAKCVAADRVSVLSDWTPERMNYRS